MSRLQIAFLGPKGTYSHAVAEKYFGAAGTMVPLATIPDVCAYVAGQKNRRGIIPSENSSGGAIFETVDILLAGTPPVQIIEEVSLKVKLALLGRRNAPIKTLYSHFAPLEHCRGWIAEHLPGVRREGVTSTAVAAQQAALEPQSAALGNRRLAALYGLDVLACPVQADIPNITSFYAIGAAPADAKGKKIKTTLAVRLLNQPGALCTFLETFRAENVNLSAILSRPIRGCPKEYVFMIDVAGAPLSPRVGRALTAAAAASAEMRLVGSYPIHTPYSS